MRLGVDFGTTRIVAARLDRGNYPVVSLEAPDGRQWDGFPALVAERGGRLIYGFEAWSAQGETDTAALRSIKRYLGEAGPDTRVAVGAVTAGMLDVLAGLASAYREALSQASGLPLKSGDPVEILLGVPANANGNQRFLTVEAFRRAGFEVLGLLNEPSAASVEFGHSVRAKGARGRGTVIVYDLGGGTFDASLVELDEQHHEVTGSEGIPTLGGDDFDALLAEMAFDAAGIPPAERDSLPQSGWFGLLEEARVKKEALHPNTRRIVVDLDQARPGWPAVTVPAAEYYERARPMIEETVHAVEELAAGKEDAIEAVYVVGGASELPPVMRILRERFGRKVKRSAYPRSAAAIGLAIQADTAAGYSLGDSFTRNFGVWREGEGGAVMVFDPLFLKGTPLPGAKEPPLSVAREYSPAHNIGHFRYLECSRTDEAGRPAGEVMIWDEIWFPFDEALSEQEELADAAVERLNWAPGRLIREVYHCDAGGAVTVTIANLSAGYSRDYRLGRWAVKQPPVKPGRPKARKPRTPSAEKS
jgi:molecular chaperone DnaK (HSP70)